MRRTVEACRELEAIQSLTLYAFSTENWRRSKTEVNALFRLLSKHIQLEIESMHREGIRVVFMGRREGLSDRVLKDMDESESLTKDNSAMLLNVAINYGGRAEIVDVCRAVGEDMKAGKIRSRDVDEAYVANRLYVPEIQNVDLLIRTSGEMRISNFLLWQLSYAEIFVTRTLWPDFRRRHLYHALAQYQLRGRRFGGR